MKFHCCLSDHQTTDCFLLKHKETSSFRRHFCMSMISRISGSRERISSFQPFHVLFFLVGNGLYTHVRYMEEELTDFGTELWRCILLPLSCVFRGSHSTFGVALGVSIWVTVGNAKGHCYPFCSPVIFYLLQGPWQQSVSTVLLSKPVEIFNICPICMLPFDDPPWATKKLCLPKL